MQYMWQWRLYGSPDQRLCDGRPVRILHPGRLNTDAGPDFFNAKIVMDGAEWAGNVELHVRASDWRRHGHDADAAYGSVILHVVGADDARVCRADGSPIPQLVMPFTRGTAERYRVLCEGSQPLRCAPWVREVAPVYITDWMEALAMERLTVKSDRVLSALRYTNGDWNQAVFITLARALGFGLNGEPMERLARSLPLSVITKKGDDTFQLEALLFGRAGLLAPALAQGADAYYTRLQTEYAFLAHKYGLQPVRSLGWKMARTRPGNQPVRRIALLARLAAGVTTLLSRLLDAGGDAEAIAAMLDVRFSGYWARHLTFGSETEREYPSALSREMLRTLVLNTAPAIYHAYGRERGDWALEERAQSLLQSLPPESNAVTRLWEAACGLRARNAWESQALLHAKRAYCEPHCCLRCRLGCRAMRGQGATNPSI